MAESLITLLEEYAKLKGLRFRLVSPEESRRAKIEQRRQDKADIAAGKISPQEVTRRNSRGLGGGLVVKDKSPAYR